MSTNPWMDRRVLNYAHQGGAREAPSSTLYALRRAVAAGAHALELDVHATADGELVVCHDATVDRTTNATGAIADMTLAEVRVLDNAYWWVPGQVVAFDEDPSAYPLRGAAPDDPELRIASLREVLEAFPGVFLNLDIKQTAPAVKPYEGALAGLLREYGRRDDVIVASFHDAALQAFSSIAPEVSVSAGTFAVAQFWQAVQDGAGEDRLPQSVFHALQVPATYERTVIVDHRFVTRAHERGVAVHVWTIDDAGEMADLVDLGVDGIMTDRPTTLSEVLAQRGAAWPG
jgi:glycerophosphoryl diester phosphodiesterase